MLSVKSRIFWIWKGMVSRMTILVEKETDDEIGFDYEEILGKVIIKAIELEKCPYQCEVSVTFTDDNGIRELNRDFRNLDVPTDVLSFPMADYSPPADFPFLGKMKLLPCILTLKVVNFCLVIL